MLELGVGADLLRGVGWIIWGLFGLALLAALIKPETLAAKAVCSLMVIALFVLPMIPGAYENYVFKQRYAEAKALFDERCKTAGEKIYKKVVEVEGVMLSNVRSRGISTSVLSDPSWPDAALPHEPSQDGYIMTFLLWEQYQDKRNDRGYLNNKPSDRPGFKFVDVSEANGSIYRHRLVLPAAREMSRELLNGKPARFAVSFANMTEPTDRQLWVAGTKVTITDSATQEVMAEKVWYAIEPGQGDTSGDRSPWAFARQCPSHIGWSGGSTRFFVDQVLSPSKGK